MERRTLRPILPKLPSNQIGDKHQMKKPNLPGVFQILFDCPPHFGSEQQVEDRISSIVQKHEDYTLIGIPPKVNPSCASSVDDSLPLPVETEYGVPKAPTDNISIGGDFWISVPETQTRKLVSDRVCPLIINLSIDKEEN